MAGGLSNKGDMTNKLVIREPWVWPCAAILLAAACIAAATVSPFDLQARRASHWAWQPVRPQTPPSMPGDTWAKTPIDQFILDTLHKNGLSPAPQADRRTLIRRLSFALIGLPPTPEETEAFVADTDPHAYEHLVDRLLASPRFGERWARHWMDLVRYAETLGNESDKPLPNAWRYRDYLIRAFNADVPYDQFVTEHLAGDLLKAPRRDPATGNNESIVATGFFWMNEEKRSPVDVRQAEADVFDNKIDVMCKTFLGLTVGCARCHDHKFDAINQADYYALYGYMKSSRYTQALLNDQPWAEAAKMLALRKAALRETASTTLIEQSRNISRYLLNSAGLVSQPSTGAAAEENLSPARAAQWSAALKEPSSVDHPLYPWLRLVASQNARPEAFNAEWKNVVDEMTARNAKAVASQHRQGDIDIADFSIHGYDRWFSEDQAFGTAPSMPGDFLPGNSEDHPIQTFFRSGAWAHSGAISRKLQGTLRSPTFTINKRFLHVFCAGRQARINVNIDHFVMIQDPLYGALRFIPNSDGGSWHTFDLSLWPGHEAYVEFADTTTPDLHDTSSAGIGADGYLAVRRVVLSDSGPPDSIEPAPALSLLGSEKFDSLPALAAKYQAVVADSLAAFSRGELVHQPNADDRAHLLAWLLEHGLLDGTGTSLDNDVRAGVGEILGDMRNIVAGLPAADRAPANIDGTPEDECVFLRGNYKTAGPLSPRRMLTAIDGAHQPPADTTASGRLALAKQFTDPANPLTARVMVNRVWLHLLGCGLVGTSDNFGALGESPTHPELLDYLADGFVKDGWSIKRLARRIVLSNAFCMSSDASADAETKDPANKLLHRANIRRLEGEAIRDGILQISGRLDNKMFGEGVEIYMTPFLDGGYIGEYGKPAVSGPMDGDGRRSVYMKIRRNFLPSMMVAFDTPPPLNTAGNRATSNVPAQALILMNDPFVAQQAQRWAQQILSHGDWTPRMRIERMYAQAYGRPPVDDEVVIALRFIDEHGEELQIAPADRSGNVKVWSDLAHVLMNVKEFIFVN